MKVNFDMLYGLSEEHLIAIPSQENYKFHQGILESWNHLKEAAATQGLEIVVISSFRSFEVQKRIWNLKATGQRELLDDQENPIAFSKFNLEIKEDQFQLIQTIMRWSALPGLSRHHWGTDLDIIDKMALEENPEYKVKLIPSEYHEGGIFSQLGEFLEAYIPQSDFFRPYSVDRGGVAPEPWHISHRTQSNHFLRQLGLEHYRKWLGKRADEIELSTAIIENIAEIFDRYILNIED